ncbi:rhamnulokinase [Bacteroidales bacterium]|nr:rhamnulokinase [Bacteroidales bacterium]
MKQEHFLAFDLGASSGRSILGKLVDGKLEMKELNRFPNAIVQVGLRSHWNILSLYQSIIEGLHIAAKENISISAIGIDTWGVDFVYIGKDGAMLSPPRAYRDVYTTGTLLETFFEIIPRQEVYELTGIQVMNFNSLYQLFAANKTACSSFEAAKDILFMPDALSYLLTGNKVCEYTIASTSQILNPRTKKFEAKLLKAAGVAASKFPEIVMPGHIIGHLKDCVAKDSGLGKVPVVAVAGHDTASAIAAVPATNKNFAYLSSGTWSLMGIEIEEPIITKESSDLNFTNEGGVEGTIRFLKNITGMWLLEQCISEWKKQGKSYSYPQLVAMAMESEAFMCFVDSDHPSFAKPDSMTKAIVDFCVHTKQRAPQTDAQFVRCIFESLALKYKYVLNLLHKISPFTIEVLHVIGGGAQNKLLNQFTANSIKLPVVAGPSEATAIGNIMMQAKAMGAVKNLQEIRNIVKASVETETYTPNDTQAWEDAYTLFESKIGGKFAIY